MPSLPCLHNKHFTVCAGYLRVECNRRVNIIPVDIVDICVSYLKDICYWKFTGDELKSFLSMKPGDCVNSAVC